MLDVAQIREAASPMLREGPTPVGPEQAAVAIVLRDQPGGAELLLIRRAERAGDPWSGHMGLPGGHWEPGDAHLVDTAVRETQEEVGLALSVQSGLVGALPTIPAIAHGRRTRLAITPYLFVTAGAQTIRPNSEVAAALWVPIDALRDPRASTTIETEVEGHPLRLPAWQFQGHVIWGLTHAMLAPLLARLP